MTQSELTGVTKIYSNDYAFAALRSDGTVRAWGSLASTLPQCMLVCMACLTMAGWAAKGMVHVAAESMQCWRCGWR